MEDKNLNCRANGKTTLSRGFSLTEIMITTSLFLTLASIGVGSYFRYYHLSLVNNEVNNVMTLMRQTRFRALKNANNFSYGIHIDRDNHVITNFPGEIYEEEYSGNQSITLDQLQILEVGLLPNIGLTNEIIFQKQTGKTNNAGIFTLGNDDFQYIFSINSQGVIN